MERISNMMFKITIKIAAILLIIPFKTLCASTSITDNGVFPNFCQIAALSPSAFADFRSTHTCCQIIESVSQAQGIQYLQKILEQNPDFLAYKEQFAKGDLIGKPKTYFFPEIGHLSPTTLRYIKIASDLKKHFGSLEQMTIVEIGGAYGGQCKVNTDIFQYKQYIIIDLPGPLALTKKFLEKAGVKNIIYLTPNDPLPTQEIDLLISNFSYSELYEPARKHYLENIITHAKRGYMICNINISPDPLLASKSTLLNELLRTSIPFGILPEIPQTGPDNYLVIWNKK